MMTDRRTVLGAATALTAMMSTKGAAAGTAGAPAAGPAKGPKGIMEIIRIYSDEKGISHFERVKVMGSPKPLPIDSVVASSIAQGTEDWHHAPYKTFTINVVGDIEGEVSDGTRVKIGKGDLVYLEDFTGKGHVTHLLTPVANLFIRMKDDFDLLKWASEEPA